MSLARLPIAVVSRVVGGPARRVLGIGEHTGTQTRVGVMAARLKAMFGGAEVSVIPPRLKLGAVSVDGRDLSVFVRSGTQVDAAAGAAGATRTARAASKAR